MPGSPLLVEHSFKSALTPDDGFRRTKRLLDGLGFSVEHESRSDLVCRRGHKTPRAGNSLLELPQIVLIKWTDQSISAAARVEPYHETGALHEKMLVELLTALEAHLARGHDDDESIRSFSAFEQRILREQYRRRMGVMVLVVGAVVLILATMVGLWILKK